MLELFVSAREIGLCGIITYSTGVGALGLCRFCLEAQCFVVVEMFYSLVTIKSMFVMLAQRW